MKMILVGVSYVMYCRLVVLSIATMRHYDITTMARQPPTLGHDASPHTI